MSSSLGRLKTSLLIQQMINENCEAIDKDRKLALLFKKFGREKDVELLMQVLYLEAPGAPLCRMTNESQ